MIGRVAVDPRFTLALTKASIDAAELSAIIARRIRPERVSRYLACLRRGLGWLVSRSITSTAPATRILPALSRSKKGFAFAEGNFRLIDFDDALQGIAIRVDHRPAQFLRQQPSGLVSDAELILQLPRRHAVGMCRHEMCRPEPRGQRQLGTMHHRSRRGRSLSTAIEAFVCVSPALQRRGALLATAGTDKTLRPTPLQQKGGAARLVGKRLLKLRKRSAFGHCAPRRGHLGQRDKPLVLLLMQ